MKSKGSPNQNFSFETISSEEIQKEIQNLDTQKVLYQNNILTKIIQENYNYFAIFLHHNINACLKYSRFPSDLKLAEVTLVHKKVKNSKR